MIGLPTTTTRPSDNVAACDGRCSRETKQARTAQQPTQRRSPPTHLQQSITWMKYCMPRAALCPCLPLCSPTLGCGSCKEACLDSNKSAHNVLRQQNGRWSLDGAEHGGTAQRGRAWRQSQLAAAFQLAPHSDPILTQCRFTTSLKNGAVSIIKAWASTSREHDSTKRSQACQLGRRNAAAPAEQSVKALASRQASRHAAPTAAAAAGCALLLPFCRRVTFM